jgi:thiol-disulfide isomerase/thioredoxin
MIRALAFLSGCNHNLCNNHRRTSQSAAAAAFVSNYPHFKLKQSSQQSQLSITSPPPTSLPISTTTTISTISSTSLHLKFKTFEEMISHHHSTPLLIDFYSPFCGPCKLMKGEIMSIRDELDILGPTVQTAVGNDNGGEEVEEEEEEDCSVEDNIALSNDCLEDGYLEERQDGSVAKDDGGGRGALSSLVKEDKTLLLNDLLPTPPPSSSTTTEEEQQHSQATKQHNTTNTPSGIPVYHVNTNKFPQVGAKNHIAGLPTLVLFYRGEELWRNEGLMKGEEILNVLVELQEGGWEKKMMIKGRSGGKDVEDVVVIHGEEVDNMTTKKKKRKGRRLGG